MEAVAAALWREGQDVSCPNTLTTIQSKLGLPPASITAADEDFVQQSTEAWMQGPFERRLPAARSRHGAVLLGLNDERRFRLFLESGLLAARHGESCC